VQEGTHGETLRRVADRLCVEFIDPDVAELPGIRSTLGEKEGMTGILDAEDEALLARVREALAGIASTLSAADAEEPPVQAIETALDGAEFVIRGELASGNTERALKLMPSLVFLVALSVADQDRALELSRRTVELIGELAP
jgi:hypothetical protein